MVIKVKNLLLLINRRLALFLKDVLEIKDIVALNSVKISKMERVTFACGEVVQTFFDHLSLTAMS